MRKLVLLAGLVGVLLPLASVKAHPPDEYGFPGRARVRAAPWFLYWPYQSYWQTPAPTGYPYNPPPMSTNGFNAAWSGAYGQYPMYGPPNGFYP